MLIIGLIGFLSNYYGHIKDRKRTRAPCSKPTTNAIGPLLECKKVCQRTKVLLQSGKVGGRGKKEERGGGTGKTEVRSR